MRLTLVVTVLLACAQMIGVVDTTSTKAAPGPLTSAFAVGVLTRAFDRQSTTWGPRHLAATLWYPAAGEAPAGSRQAIADAPPSQRGPFPLIVYSHGGCGGSPQAIAPLAVAIASAGFVFVQFPHPGSTTDDCVAEGPRYTRGVLERPDDIVYVIDALGRLNDDSSSRLHGIIETHRVGIIGHSQGGQTALMMPARDARILATLSISPSVAHADTPAAVWQAIKMARVPVMIMHGTRDATWTSDGPRKAYGSLPADTPRAYLEIDGMGHTPSTASDVAVVLRYATAFFRYYLQHDASAAAMLAPDAAPTTVALESARFP